MSVSSASVSGESDDVSCVSYGIEKGYFEDFAHGRDILYKAYLPDPTLAAAADDPCPPIIVSHPLGGSRKALASYCKALANEGFLVVALQHAGSDSSIKSEVSTRQQLVEKISELSRSDETLENVVNDITFAYEDLVRCGTTLSSVFCDRVDLSKGFGIIGQSFGARAALVAAGELFKGKSDLKHGSLRACALLSPSAPEGEDEASLASLYANVDTAALLHITGTLDLDPIRTDLHPSERLLPFQNINSTTQYLLNVTNATHAVVGGIKTDLGFFSEELQPLVDFDEPHDVITASLISFFRAHLGKEHAQREYLDGEFRELAEQTGEWVIKA
eukprot:TRINITY_DN1500_c0_g1_i1.p1 TRINITY_DN1500_c0_g1~~TRINITY_DN1500_c0_g1_i1.p1  ORF type:complete len:332 (-),score=65.41 TRINITY_DN1500_c0_g1_i1:232-1227(-)